MGKLKDFIYNISDFVVVLIIIAFAALFIFIAVDNVMDYPTESGAVTLVDETKINDEPLASDEVQVDAQGEDELILGDDGIAYPASIYISYGDSLETIGSGMVAINLFESVEEFKTYVENSGLETKIQAGSFVIPQGASHEEVLSIITGPANQ